MASDLFIQKGETMTIDQAFEVYQGMTPEQQEATRLIASAFGFAVAEEAKSTMKITLDNLFSEVKREEE